jgi:hypothetical protein
MICHYLYNTNKDIIEIYDIFNEITKEELIYIINSYTHGIYNIIQK